MNVYLLNNYMDYVLRRDYGGGTGNANWSGFLYVCIRGGQQDTTETHLGENLLLFNPACEFATAEVCLDIDLVMAYYALISVNRAILDEQRNKEISLIEYLCFPEQTKKSVLRLTKRKKQKSYLK